jgi:hypothetical protein
MVKGCQNLKCLGEDGVGLVCTGGESSGEREWHGHEAGDRGALLNRSSEMSSNECGYAVGGGWVKTGKWSRD